MRKSCEWFHVAILMAWYAKVRIPSCAFEKKTLVNDFPIFLDFDTHTTRARHHYHHHHHWRRQSVVCQIRCVCVNGYINNGLRLQFLLMMTSYWTQSHLWSRGGCTTHTATKTCAGGMRPNWLLRNNYNSHAIIAFNQSQCLWNLRVCLCVIQGYHRQRSKLCRNSCRIIFVFWLDYFFRPKLNWGIRQGDIWPLNQTIGLVKLRPI